MIVGIILAAGNGSRMDQQEKKQFIQIHNKPLLYYPLLTFEKSEVDQIILVTAEDDITFCENEIVHKNGFCKVSKVIKGGKERYLSVMEALKYVNDNDIVLIHDGARPCVSMDLVHRVIQCVKEKGGCITVVPVHDTIKLVDDNKIVKETIPRDNLVAVQTPQGFYGKKIKDAYHQLTIELDQGKELSPTDDGMVYELFGKGPLYTVEGEYTNKKVTTKEDLLFAKTWLK